MSKALWLIALASLSACGGDDDDNGDTTRPAGAPAPAAGGAAKKDPSKQLQPRQHIEDKVSCSVPDAPTGHPACTPVDQPLKPGDKLLPDCDPGSYCMQVGNGFSCEPCPERESIRHEFKDRDFVEDQARDPFESYVVIQPGLGQGSSTSKPEPHQSCKRADQFVATGYSYQDLKLVGIVAQSTQRKVLMMDTGNPPIGHIIKRGDCVGKEKAVVKDIGTGYVTFVVDEDPDTKRPATETSVQLHPGGLEVEPLSPQFENQRNPSSGTPVVAPPGTPNGAGTPTQSPPPVSPPVQSPPANPVSR
ncbi:MAG: hypothetical protein QM831_20265 [Kofleriaceae bacterium]